MNINILDKAIKIRHILILFVIVLFFSFICYVCSFFMVGLLHHHGGGYSLNSPYAKFFPDNCKKYTAVSGAFQNETTIDTLLLKTRHRRIKINNPALDYSSASHMTCLGYTVMGGLHEGSVGATNFTHEFQNAKGEPIATVQVKYHKAHPYPATDLIEELKVNSK